MLLPFKYLQYKKYFIQYNYYRSYASIVNMIFITSTFSIPPEQIGRKNHLETKSNAAVEEME